MQQGIFFVLFLLKSHCFYFKCAKFIFQKKIVKTWSCLVLFKTYKYLRRRIKTKYTSNSSSLKFPMGLGRDKQYSKTHTHIRPKYLVCEKSTVYIARSRRVGESKCMKVLQVNNWPNRLLKSCLFTHGRLFTRCVMCRISSFSHEANITTDNC